MCVTGGSGYVGSWIVKVLLDRGYTVNATVRSLNDPRKVNHLLALDGAKERLHLFEATLMEEGSFDSAIHGCDGVFHTASPVSLDSPNPQLDIIDPAVKGTLNVLASCVKHPTVKRVVFTSSMAAVLLSGKPLNADVVVDETWFSAAEICNQSKLMKWYLISKTLAEESAWKFAKENGIDMVSVNPGVVIGPLLQPSLASSVGAYVYGLVNGSETYPNVSFGWVHIKDVADAHVLAFENPSANGRYLLVESVAHFSEVVKILHELYPNLKLPNKCENDEPLSPAYKVAKEKVESLGIKYIPLKESLHETIEWMKEKNLISF